MINFINNSESKILVAYIDYTFDYIGYIQIIRILEICFIKSYNMENAIAGKVVVITGANSGIGEATAEMLANRGAGVLKCIFSSFSNQRTKSSMLICFAEV